MFISKDHCKKLNTDIEPSVTRVINFIIVELVFAYKNSPKFDRNGTKNMGIGTSQKRRS
jgi:hypothetical protein